MEQSRKVMGWKSHVSLVYISNLKKIPWQFRFSRDYIYLLFLWTKVLYVILFHGPLPLLLNLDLQQWMHLWLNITQSWYVLLFIMDVLMSTAHIKRRKYIPYKLSIEKQQSIIDAWGLDLQNDI